VKTYESVFTILIVDDDEGHVELVRRNLSRIALGNPLIAISDGARALDYIFRRGEFAGRQGADPLVLLAPPGRPGQWEPPGRLVPPEQPGRRGLRGLPGLPERPDRLGLPGPLVLRVRPSRMSSAWTRRFIPEPTPSRITRSASHTRPRSAP